MVENQRTKTNKLTTRLNKINTNQKNEEKYQLYIDYESMKDFFLLFLQIFLPKILLMNYYMSYVLCTLTTLGCYYYYYYLFHIVIYERLTNLK